MTDHSEDNVLEVEGKESTWIAVARVGTEDEARLIAGFLEAEGIASNVEVVRFNVEPVNFGDMSDVRVYVRSESEERAIQLISERRAAGENMADDGSIMTEDGPQSVEDASAEETQR